MKDYILVGFYDACNIKFLSLKQAVKRLYRVNANKRSKSVIRKEDAAGSNVQATNQSRRFASGVMHEKHFGFLLRFHVSSIVRFCYPGTCRVIFIFLDTGYFPMLAIVLLQSVTI